MSMQPYQPDLTVGSILCCVCGAPITPNPSNKCAECLRAQVDITEGISRQNIVVFCRGCERYLQPPKTWVTCTLESRELLTICLKTLKGLNKVRLVDARFLWTEPHSRRLIVRLTIQKEVSGAILQQEFDVTYVVKTQQCDLCTRAMASDTWSAVVQLRQKVDHKRTFLFLEQQILKHRAQKDVIKIKSYPDGIDFYFGQKSQADRFAQFIQDFATCREKQSEQMISQDVHNHTEHKKQAISLEIAPVCRDDLVWLDKKVAMRCGSISQLCLVRKITTAIHLVDPDKMIFSDCAAQIYWGTPFIVLANAAQLSKYFVKNIDLTSKIVGKYQQADVVLEKLDEKGNFCGEFTCKTHLGNLLTEGDLVLGYDMTSLNPRDSSLTEKKAHEIPDVLIVRKTYELTERRKQNRKFWRLKRLTVDEEDEREQKRDMIERKMRDEDIFINEIEENKEFRSEINIYKNINTKSKRMEKDIQPSSSSSPSSSISSASSAAGQMISSLPVGSAIPGLTGGRTMDEDDDGADGIPIARDDDDDDDGKMAIDDEDDEYMIKLTEMMDDLEVADTPTGEEK
ncbi:putative 60S ribosomal export protein [Monocercomonoides exilis]|uniref:putative 60S ribosomal export protein n=1 Tax=Monocercomonoides exilis TaxID=2049356 RepID=UPI00355AC8DF|nr:putative 60S ribosomal export protein [Monocercomonoides exilis]